MTATIAGNPWIFNVARAAAYTACVWLPIAFRPAVRSSWRSWALPWVLATRSIGFESGTRLLTAEKPTRPTHQATSGSLPQFRRRSCPWAGVGGLLVELDQKRQELGADDNGGVSLLSYAAARDRRPAFGLGESGVERIVVVIGKPPSDVEKNSARLFNRRRLYKCQHRSRWSIRTSLS